MVFLTNFDIIHKMRRVLFPAASANPHRQSRLEEIVNSVTHGLGIPMSIVALVVLVVQAMNHTTWHVVSVSIFGGSMILIYMASCLYHAVCVHKHRRVFQVLDHCFIFVLIAGTYTPFTLVNLRGPVGWTMFGIVWTLAIAGIIMKCLVLPRYDKSSSVIYLVMGWIAVFGAFELIDKVPMTGVVWLAIGGAFYTIGVIFFLLDRIRFAHAIWHVFVLGGSLSHILAVFHGVVPSGS